MMILAISIILFSCGMILFHRRDDIYDKVISLIFVMFAMFFSFIIGMAKNLPDSYLAPMDINVMVHNCQKDLPPYAKCVITVSKPNITEKQP